MYKPLMAAPFLAIVDLTNQYTQHLNFIMTSCARRIGRPRGNKISQLLQWPSTNNCHRRDIFCTVGTEMTRKSENSNILHKKYARGRRLESPRARQTKSAKVTRWWQGSSYNPNCYFMFDHDKSTPSTNSKRTAMATSASFDRYSTDRVKKIRKHSTLAA